ncbi:hypothetical protein niasHT_019838 [Heterodera trifolii]|uniref:Uncharacterized protein n=1 Tax=Heterodera trifolii TaxID=157864 RepID=A0ABD2KUT8_9BILA
MPKQLTASMTSTHKNSSMISRIQRRLYKCSSSSSKSVVENGHFAANHVQQSEIDACKWKPLIGWKQPINALI